MLQLPCRILALGDLFALRTPDSTGQSALLDALSRPEAGDGSRQQELSYFKVTQMAPATGTSLLVDSRRTAVTLEVRRVSGRAHGTHGWCTPLLVSLCSMHCKRGAAWNHAQHHPGT